MNDRPVHHRDLTVLPHQVRDTEDRLLLARVMECLPLARDMVCRHRVEGTVGPLRLVDRCGTKPALDSFLFSCLLV